MTSNYLNFLLLNDFKPRPGAGSGIWILFLLPTSLVISVIKHPIVVMPIYKLTSLCCIGLMISSLQILLKMYRNQQLKVLSFGNLFGAVLTTIVIHMYFHKGWDFSVLSGITVTFLYTKLLTFILKKFKECFTIGEAGLASQAIVIVLYSLVNSVMNFIKEDMVFRSNMQISTVIIQVGLLSIGTIAWTVYMFNIRNTVTLYSVAAFLVVLIILLPLHILLNRSPLIWIIQLLFYDTLSIKLSSYWAFCCIVAGLAVNKQIRFAKKASTGTRKIFHILAVFIFIPGLFFRCSLLYLASGVVTGIFFFLEILRVLEVPPLGQHLQDGFVVFSDEKDIGNIALTPIYLLISCSLPLWLHPSPCDITDSVIFGATPLLSGLLAIGVGDTAASIIGSRYGRTFWPGSKKTIEGTIACIFSQVGFIHLLVFTGCMHRLSKDYLLRVYFSIFVTSLVEAKTTQIDNLVLPFIMYILLI